MEAGDSGGVRRGREDEGGGKGTLAQTHGRGDELALGVDLEEVREEGLEKERRRRRREGEGDLGEVKPHLDQSANRCELVCIRPDEALEVLSQKERSMMGRRRERGGKERERKLSAFSTFATHDDTVNGIVTHKQRIPQVNAKENYAGQFASKRAIQAKGQGGGRRGRE